MAGRRRPRPRLSGIRPGPRSPGPRRAAPRSRRAARGPQAAAAEEAETTKAAAAARGARGARCGRSVGPPRAQRVSAQSGLGASPGPARPLGGRGEGRGGECRGGARRAGGGSPGAGRGARPGPTGRFSAPRGQGSPVAPADLSPARGRRRRPGTAQAAAGVPEGGPPTPRARGGGTTCGGGAGRGGGAEAGLPPPDVTSRLPRAYQGPPRPQPNSASSPASSPSRLPPRCPASWQRAPRSLPRRPGTLCPPPTPPAVALLLACTPSPAPRLPRRSQPPLPGSSSDLMFLWGTVGGSSRKLVGSLDPSLSQPYREAEPLSRWRSSARRWSPPRDSSHAGETKMTAVCWPGWLGSGR